MSEILREATPEEAARFWPDGVPEGYRAVVVVDGDWHLTDPGKKCRMGAGPGKPSCGLPSVAQLRRGRQWWAYCGEHLYGRWLEGGKVCIVNLRRAEPSPVAGEEGGER